MDISNFDLLPAETTSLSPLLPKPAEHAVILVSDKQDRMEVFLVPWVTGSQLPVHSSDTMMLWLMANSYLRDNAHLVSKYSSEAEDVATAGSCVTQRDALEEALMMGESMWPQSFSFSFF